MKIVRFTMASWESYGILEGDKIHETTGNLDDFMQGTHTLTGATFNLNEVQLLSPCLPGKVLCLGLNYRSHAEEVGLEIPQEPILFMKPSTSVIGHEEYILYPPQSKRVDYEAELGVVIGEKCSGVKAEQALKYVLGYCCSNDVTARDLQPKRGQWTYAKSFDTFCPVGPWVETRIENPDDLVIRGYLNHKQVQEGSTRDHIFTVPEIIEYISKCMTLMAGDIILTGTPSGIGPMKSGDVFEVEIPAVGTLRNEIHDKAKVEQG